jgi:hypothetical protein
MQGMAGCRSWQMQGMAGCKSWQMQGMAGCKSWQAQIMTSAVALSQIVDIIIISTIDEGSSMGSFAFCEFFYISSMIPGGA